MKTGKKQNSHGSFVVFSGFPVSVGHGELVEIREERRNHRVRWPVHDLDPTRVLPIRAVLFRLHSLSQIPRAWSFHFGSLLSSVWLSCFFSRLVMQLQLCLACL